MYRVGVIAGGAAGAGAALELGLAALNRIGIQVDHRTIDLGAARYLRTGEVLPPSEIDRIRELDALLCGSPPSSADPTIPAGLLERGIVFGLRRELGLAVNLREFPGLGTQADVDVAVVRENSEGSYSTEGTVLHRGTEFETATEVSIATRPATLRCLRFAFGLARERRQRLIVAHKSRVLLATGGLWQRAARDVSTEYPDVEWDIENVDTLCARLIQVPQQYGVIATDNVFGDIVSDVAAAATRSTGYAASAELSARPDGPSLFEPMHGPQEPGCAEPTNPLGALSAAAMMARHLGERTAGDALHTATLTVAAGNASLRGTELLDTVCATAHQLLKAAN